MRTTGALDVSALDVALDLFDTYGARILAGRAFTADDTGAAHAVIVNRSFVRQFLENRSALGLRFRYARSRAESAEGTVQQASYQIVGIVDDFPSFPPAPGSDGHPTIYHPAMPGDVHPVALTRAIRWQRSRELHRALSKNRRWESIPRCNCAASCRCRSSTVRCDRSGITSRGASAW